MPVLVPLFSQALCHLIPTDFFADLENWDCNPFYLLECSNSIIIILATLYGLWDLSSPTRGWTWAMAVKVPCPNCKKRHRKKEPPLWTVDQGLLLGGRSQAELPGAGKQGSEGGLQSKGSLQGKGSLRNLRGWGMYFSDNWQGLIESKVKPWRKAESTG